MAPTNVCEAWAALDDLVDGCPCRVVESGDESPTDDQLQEVLDSATDLLWSLLARPAIGVCEITVWPCAKGPRFWGPFGREWYPWGEGPWSWGNLGGCWGCGHERDVRLDGPVFDVTEVLIDGVALDPSEYVLVDEVWLVRVGGSWPDGGGDPADESFVITYERGIEVPPLIRDATLELANELWLDRCGNATCKIPGTVESLSTQGANYSYAHDSIDDAGEKLPMTNKAISQWNPTREHLPAYIYSSDMPYTNRIIRTFA